MSYKRVLVKVSGESLLGKSSNGILSHEALFSTAQSIAELEKQNIQVCVVIGAGNICRGSIIQENGIDRVVGDKMGMLGTVINSFAMVEAIKSFGVKAVAISSVRMEDFVETFSPELADKYLNDNYVVVYAGGTGKPFFTTDTGATLHAIETNCDAILIGKNGVDGIYDSDPRKNPNAKFIKTITCSEVLEKKLAVMDLTAVEMLKDKDIDVRLFNMNVTSNLLKVAKGEDIGTTLKKG